MKQIVIVLLMALAMGCSAVVTPPTPAPSATPFVQTVVVPQIVVITTTPAPTIASAATAQPPAATPTNTPTRTLVPTSAPANPSASMPSGWVQVEQKNTSGQALSFNHDNDGDLHMVFLTWGTVTASGQDLGTNVVRVSQDPAGEKVTVNGGWAKFQWQGAANPTKEQVTELVNWRMAQLGGSYTVSWQQVTTAPYEAKHAAQPSDWKEFKDPKYTGDKLITIPVLLDANQVAFAWFWATSGGQKPTAGCTIYVMTKSGDATFQGGLRYFALVNGGSFTKEQFQVLVSYWKDVLQRENRGTCPSYSVQFQDSNWAF